jgi:hypothetical protein
MMPSSVMAFCRLTVLRVSVVNKVLEFFLSLDSRKLVGNPKSQTFPVLIVGEKPVNVSGVPEFSYA